MGLFRKTLRDIEKQVHLGRFVQARAALEDHINAEHTVEGDLAGLAAAIQLYRRKLLDAKTKLTLLNTNSKKTTPAQIEEDLALARNELVKIQALISKLRNESKLELS